MPPRNFEKISHKNRENQEKWEEKGKLAPADGLATALQPDLILLTANYSETYRRVQLMEMNHNHSGTA